LFLYVTFSHIADEHLFVERLLSMTQNSDEVWCGSLDGVIRIFDIKVSTIFFFFDDSFQLLKHTQILHSLLTHLFTLFLLSVHCVAFDCHGTELCIEKGIVD
jgi:hypothetical protein